MIDDDDDDDDDEEEEEKKKKKNNDSHKNTLGGVDGTVARESALRSAGNLLWWARAPLPVPWPEGGSESLRSPCCGLAIYNRPN
ncbi:hypothetical protein PoB_003959700 [Plakobranchus ocellatus]|uniref:Uncharacterized protein n=1 Tax=Plakobranchus ocellatus TaxID=259542 RepID=A0AAV4B1H5_9GAST|nr:hypothetical protein PoB_003959700 [Plakobranchus ocellatus]